MKTAISSYSFSQLMSRTGDTQLTVIKKAKELGFDAIEFTDLMPEQDMTELQYAALLKDEANAVGIEISCYSVGANLLLEDLDAEVERVKSKVDTAYALGAKLMRHDASFGFVNQVRGYRGFTDVVDILADGCRRITEYAQSKGIRTMVENHGFFCQDSDRVELLVNRVAHPNFGLQVDMGNFLCVDEDPAMAVSRCAPYAYNVHAKDFIFKRGEEGCPGDGFIHTRAGNYIRGTILGHGVVPIRQCVAAFKNAGYDGYLTLEFEGHEQVEFALEQGAKYLQHFV